MNFRSIVIRALVITIVVVVNTPLLINSASALTNKNQNSEGGDGRVEKSEPLPNPDPVPAPKPAKNKISTSIFLGETRQWRLDSTLNSKLEGKITSTNNNADKAACGSISIVLKEIYQAAHFQSTNRIAQVNATGNTLSSGCNYTLNYAAVKGDSFVGFKIQTIVLINNSAIKLTADQFFKEMPSTVDLVMK